MLSSVLRSNQAVQISIEVMRAFVRLRGLLTANRELAGKFNELLASNKATRYTAQLFLI